MKETPSPEDSPLGCILMIFILLFAIAAVGCLHAAWFAFRMEVWRWLTGE